jgi:hypothetical protein
MSLIKVTLPLGEIPVTGKQVSFVAPCSCEETTGLEIEGEQYTVVDAMCTCVTGKGGRWNTGAIVSVILDVDNKEAYIQNADNTIFTYGTEDLEAGVSPLETGKLYLMYE